MNLTERQLDIATLMDHYRQCGIYLYVKNSELGYRAAKGTMTPEIIATIRARKSEILQFLTILEDSHFRTVPTSKKRAQLFNRFLWKDYANRIMEVNSANVTRIVKRYKGEMLTDALLQSVNILLDRHDILSSSIEMAEGKLCLVCHEKVSVTFEEFVAKGTKSQQREEDAHRIANDLVWKEYDLDRGPLYRIFLVRFSSTDYILGLALHHAIGDLLSIGILYRDLFSIYHSVVNRTPLRLTTIRLRYMDYLAAMEAWATSAACGEQIRYWKDKLKSTPVTDLLPYRNRSFDEKSTESTAEAKLLLNAETALELKEMAVQLKTTLFTVLIAIYKIALWRMTGQEDVVVVALHAGRLDAGFQNTIGDFALEVAYKTSIMGCPSFSELIGRVIHTMNEANSHQPVPLDWVRCALAEEGIPFFAPGINFMSGGNNNTRNPLEPRPLSFTPPGMRHGCHGFKVSCAIEFRDSNDVIEGSMVYRNDLYEESTIHEFTNCFYQTVSDVIRFPEKKLSPLRLTEAGLLERSEEL